MNEPNAVPDATSTAPADPTTGAIAAGSVALDLGGVSAPADVGSLGALPNVAGAAQIEGTSQLAGAAPDALAASATIPGANDSEPEPVDVMPEVIATVNAIEQLALFWGGDTGVKIRNHTGRLRELLQA